MCKKKSVNQLTKEDKIIVNHGVLKRYNVGENIRIPRGKYKGKEGVIKMVYFNGGSEWANLEVYDEKKDKTYIVDAIDVYEFEKVKKG